MEYLFKNTYKYFIEMSWILTKLFFSSALNWAKKIICEPSEIIK